MRIAPVAVFYRDNYENMIEVARQTTLLTHTHRLGVNGALLQVIYIKKNFHVWNVKAETITKNNPLQALFNSLSLNALTILHTIIMSKLLTFDEFLLSE